MDARRGLSKYVFLTSERSWFRRVEILGAVVWWASFKLSWVQLGKPFCHAGKSDCFWSGCTCHTGGMKNIVKYKMIL